MKNTIVTLILALTFCHVSAQIATDFTANDCNGNPHNLFTELNAGKVIVLCWVMPCSACLNPALSTNNVVQGYQTSNPNTVFFYMCDDYANSTCATINSWANANGIPQSSTSLRFSNASINMTDYGSTGMPKIVVIGGASHTVFYNTNNTVNIAGLQNAINSALNTTGIDESLHNVSSFSVSPNPSSNTSEIKFHLKDKSEVTLELYNLEGQLINKIYSGSLSAGENKILLDVSAYSSGMYLVKLTTGRQTKFLNLIISE